jgi:putative membrane protein
VGDANSDMAVMRTQMASERTLMAWVRTSFSMISFGFTIAKVFEYLNEHDHHSHRMGEARALAVLLIVLGLASMLAGVWEYHRALRQLDRITGEHHAVPREVLTISILVAVLGVTAFVGIFVHIRFG